MSWQLVAHYDDELRVLLGSIVRRTLQRIDTKVNLAYAQNLLLAQECIEGLTLDECSLVIVGSTMPADATVCMGAIDRNPTMRFVRKLKAKNPDLPVIVVSSLPDAELAELVDEDRRTALVTVGESLGQSLAARLEELHGGIPQVFKSWVQLDIHLGGNQAGNWQLRRTGTDAFETAGPLLLDSSQLKRVLQDSERLNRDVAEDRERHEWHQKLDSLSHELRVLLFRGAGENIKCWDKFLKHRERAGGVPHSRVRITVDEKMHPMLLEALKDDEDDEYWALKAPLYRRYAERTFHQPLFKDSATRHDPVNALIIEADRAAGEVPDAPGGPEFFDSLPRMGTEADAIEAILGPSTGGVVDRLSIAKLDGDLAKTILRKLEERQWHIVHFCGHTSGATSENAGLVLRADRQGILPVKTLVKRLDRTQLLFLSSCRSASTKIVMHAVERHVPAILGFQWVIDDHYACEFAQAFYQSLFAKHDPSCYRYLEYACMRARRAIHDNHYLDVDPEDPSPWVAPVLIMQMG